MKNTELEEASYYRYIVPTNQKGTSVANAALIVIDKMKEFYQNLGIPVQEILEFEYEKFIDAGNRYAWIIREQFKGGFVKKAMKFVKERQEKMNV